jgi:ribosomal protein S27E
MSYIAMDREGVINPLEKNVIPNILPLQFLLGNFTKEGRNMARKTTKEDILRRFIETHGDKYDYSKVIYENTQKKVCIICQTHGEFWQSPNAHYKSGCLPCSREKQSIEQAIPNGNSIRDINPDIVKYLKNESDADKYKCYSNSVITFKCPDCGNEKNAVISNITMYRFSCAVCSDSMSLPEKFASSVFTQSTVQFEPQKRFDWSGRKRYDFYFTNHNIIIETHGMHHYKQSTRSKNIEIEIENDNYKKQIAVENGISDYIVIDCRLSDFGWLKKNFIEQLSHIIDFSKIDWDVVLSDLNYNYIHEVWRTWNEREYWDTLSILAKKVGISYTTYLKYIRLGREIGKIEYDEEYEKMRLSDRMSKSNSKSIHQYTLDGRFIKTWGSVRDASKFYNVGKGSIYTCAKGKCKSIKGYSWSFELK